MVVKFTILVPYFRYPEEMNHRVRNMLLLSVAYAANIGGTGILTGSPPNLVVLTQLQGSNVSYYTWLYMGFISMSINLLASYLYLLLASEIPRLCCCDCFSFFDPSKEKLTQYNSKHGLLKSIPRENQEENIELSIHSDLNSSQESEVTHDSTTDNPMPENEVNKDKNGAQNVQNGAQNGVLTKAERKAKEKEEAEENDRRLKKFIEEEQQKLGAFSQREFLMLLCFVILVCLWLFRDPKVFQGMYSSVPNKRTSRISVQARISVQGGVLTKIK